MAEKKKKKSSAYITPEEKKKIFPRGWALKRRQDWPLTRSRKMFERAEKERKERYPKATPELKRKLKEEREKEILRKDKGGLVGSITHSVSGWWKKKKKEQEKAVETVAPVAATTVGGPGAGAAVEAGIQAKQAAEAQKEAAKAKERAAEEEKETAEAGKKKESWTKKLKQLRKEIRGGGEFSKEKYEELERLEKLEERKKKLEEEEERKKGPLGKIGGFLKKGYEKEKHELKITGIKGLGERKEAAKKTVFSSVQFLFMFPFTIWLLFSSTIPTIEGYTGKPIVPRQLAWIQARAVDIALVIFVFVLVVLLIPSLIRGGRGIDLSLPNGIILTILAVSVGLWLFDNPFFSFIGYVKAAHPEEYEMMMCLIKYSGNMQICALGEEEIQYEKEGTYQTLKLEMGIVTPDRTIPPMRPDPSQINEDNPYIFTFTLKNENEVGSLYDIVVPSIIVDAFEEESGGEGYPSEITYPPPYSVIPGGYEVVEAEFNLLPTVERYVYFQINITTEQLGGGSAKIGGIESGEEISNKNFMYFFDPEIKTETGPLDIYVFSIPFVISVDDAWDRQGEGYPPPTNKTGFRAYIHLINKGGGIGEMINLTLVQTTESIPITIECDGGTKSDDYCPPGKTGNCIFFDAASLTSLGTSIIEKGSDGNEIYMIRCEGWVTSDDFIGKATDFISVIANYNYTQTYDEQISISSLAMGRVPEGGSGCQGDPSEGKCKNFACPIFCGSTITAGPLGPSPDKDQFFVFTLPSSKDVSINLSDSQGYQLCVSWVTSGLLMCPSCSMDSCIVGPGGSCEWTGLGQGTYYIRVQNATDVPAGVTYSLSLECT